MQNSKLHRSDKPAHKAIAIETPGISFTMADRGEFEAVDREEQMELVVSE